MSGYFDALIRSSGMTTGRPEPSPVPLEAAIEVDVDRSTAGTEANAMRPPSATHEPLAPPRVSEVVERTVLLRALGRVDPHVREEPHEPLAPARGAPEPAADSPVEPPKPDLGPTLVRAAMRWIAAGTPQVSPVNTVSLVSDAAPDVPRRQLTVPPVHEQTTSLATNKRPGDGDDAQSESLDAAPVTPAPSRSPTGESIAVKSLPIRASLVPPAPLPPAAPSVRDEVVEVSIGAIHVRVDAPPAQTIARPALTPAAAAPGAAAPRPARSALSRRALRRI